jgi:hypothetical protein
MKAFGQVFHRRLASRQALEDGPTGRVRQSPEDGVMLLHDPFE